MLRDRGCDSAATAANFVRSLRFNLFRCGCWLWFFLLFFGSRTTGAFESRRGVAFCLRIRREQGRPIALFPLRFVELDSSNLGRVVGRAAFPVLEGLASKEPGVRNHVCPSMPPQWLASIHLDGDFEMI